MTELNFEGMVLADGVVETIVAIAVQGIEGVSLVGANSPSGLFGSLAAKPQLGGIDVESDDTGILRIAVHVVVEYGYPLTDIAERIRSAIASAILTQVGIEAVCVDVYIDGIQF